MTIPSLTPILNDTAGTATNINANFQAIEAHINTELIDRSGAVAMAAPLAGVPAVNPNELVVLSQLDSAIPAGITTAYTASIAPAGWVLAQGQEVSETDPTYANLKTLYEADGYPYNDGGESPGNFRLPDLRERFPRGKGAADTLGASGGSADAVLIAHGHTIPSHQHGMAHTHSINHGHADNFSIANDTHKHDGNSFAKWDAAGQTISYGGTWQSGSTMALRSMSNDTHNHVLNGAVTNHTGSSGAASTATTDGSGQLTADSAGAGDGVGANLPPYLILNYIVKL